MLTAIGIIADRYSALELLSTIREIRGALEIKKFPGTTFPYLRNLQRVGTVGSQERISVPRCGNFRGSYSMSCIVSHKPSMCCMCNNDFFFPFVQMELVLQFT